MFDIITFGSAAKDIFLRSKNLKVVGEKKFVTGKGLCFSFGSKIDVENIAFTTGGGGTNTAATFVNQGFKTAYCGVIGKDKAGDEILQELKGLGIDTGFVKRISSKITNHSVILSSFSQKERTILVYRGASGEQTKKDIPWPKLKAKWFYLAPFSGQQVLLSEMLVNFAKKNRLKIAMNPSIAQLSLPQAALKRILSKVDVLILNREEASFLTNLPYKNEVEIFKKLDAFVPGICIMTKGSKGVVVSDGKLLYKAGSLGMKAVDFTGAGDSFAAGFVSGLIQSKGSIEYAIQLGMANGGFCLTQLGAKKGLLKKNQKWRKVKVQKEICSLNNRCLLK
ncbi:MAG: PfkB family carbohydrate kinase [Candidatus Nealsonbacteria bacterium]|nr:PfkB family carbohydrate kinase [Candidatus Nealsonbacteria bacterium]